MNDSLIGYFLQLEEMGYAQKNTYGNQINKLISNMCNDELTYYILQLEKVRWTTKKTYGNK
jgi:hypothetical protein